MKITPLEIRQKAFEKVFRGYDKDEVQAFLQILSSEWEKSIDEKKELVIKLEAAEREIMKLREVEIQQGKGLDTVAACRAVGITDATYYRWRKEYGGMKIDQAKKYKELERENARLKRLVADLSLDNAILKEVNEGNF